MAMNKLASASPCIYKVPINLRKINEAAYTPQSISIGPFHHGKLELLGMENHKRRYKEAFDKRITVIAPEEFKKFIKDNEENIRHQYAESFTFSSDEFVEMILYDAIFIIELFLRTYLLDTIDFLLEKVWLGALRRDLQLLENQLPYFVLEGLYNLANLQDEIFTNFRHLSCAFFRLHLSHNRPPYNEEIKVKHFTDLCRQALVETQPIRKLGPSLKELPNVVKLRKSGVKFNHVLEQYLVDIKLEKSKRRPSSFFNEVELKIPRIYVYGNTESLIRNVMALEQCHYSSEVYVCGYIDLMDSLIKTEEDVDLLVERGIIYNFVGSNAVIADMFNKLCLGIPRSHHYYFDIYNDLRAHYDNRWNNAMTTLKSVYFSDPWKGMGTVVAVVLVLLTLAQTILSIWQVLLAMHDAH